MNYNMSGMDKAPNDLLAMLKTTEAGMQKNRKHVMLVNKDRQFQKEGQVQERQGRRYDRLPKQD